jgi:hypothetical protein
LEIVNLGKLYDVCSLIFGVGAGLAAKKKKKLAFSMRNPVLGLFLAKILPSGLP